MTAKPTEEEIMEAVKASGYLMEQEVGTALESLGYHVETNWAFADSDEGKSRELDVRAIKRVAYNEAQNLSAFVELLIECKNTSNPFVFLTRPKNEVDHRRQPYECVFPYQDYEAKKSMGPSQARIQNTPSFFHLGFDKIHSAYLSSSKAVQFCRITGNPKKWQADHGGLYDSLFFPMAKALKSRRSEVGKNLNRTRESTGYMWFWFPMIVCSGPLYVIDSTAPDPNPVECDSVTFQRELKSSNLEGRFSLDFVQQEKLDVFIQSKVLPIAEHMMELTNNKSVMVLKKDIQWKD